ncbi:MAG: asparagine--tRNA ligase [Candidatus Marsarchaeota archaeon]|nr:asparagine--tRNA ligase [Candidatus Marsarchaeota archaeon]
MEKTKETVELEKLKMDGLEEFSKKVTKIADVSNHNNNKIILRGWVYRQRRTGNKSFIVLRDGTGIIQCVVDKEKVGENEWKNSNDVFVDSVISLSGVVKEDSRAPSGYEVQVDGLILDFKGDPFPISKDQSTEFLLDVRHLWVRSQHIIEALKMKAALLKECRSFLDERGFIEVQTPMFTSSAAESGATVFEVKYFNRKAYLAQTGQLYSEALIGGYPLVYVFAPSFRSEPSRTPRHLTEFWQLEPEMAFYNQDMNMKLQEELIEYVVHNLAKKYPDTLKKFNRDPQDLLDIKAPFERLPYTKAVEKLQEKGVNIKWGDDIGLDEEKILVKDYKQPVFLTNFPKDLKAFYMKINDEDPRTVKAADMLAPEGIGEIIGGSERVYDYNELVQRINEQGLKKEDYEWYLDLRKYGSVPHSGFGMGSERVLRWILKLETVRDAIPFPRTINRLAP